MVIWALSASMMRLNESPSKKEGKYILSVIVFGLCARLNESPSKKEGKSQNNEVEVAN